MKVLLAPLLLAGLLLPAAPAAAQEDVSCPTYTASVAPEVVRPGESATVTVTVRGPRRSVTVSTLAADPRSGERTYRSVAELGPGTEEQVVTGLVPLTATRDVSALVSDTCETAGGGVVVRDGAPRATTRVRVADPAVPVQVGEADSGRTVRLLPGEQLDVRLAGGPWQGPSDGPSLYRRVVEHGPGGARALYQAMSPAYDRQGVPQPQVLTARSGDRTWSLTVQVEGPAVEPVAWPCTAVAQASPAPGTTYWSGLQSGSVPFGRPVVVVVGNEGRCSDPGPLEWRDVQLEGEALRGQVQARSVGASVAYLQAVQPGTVTLSVARDAACLHTLLPDGSRACDLDPGPVRTAQVTVLPPTRCPAGEALTVDRTRSTHGRPVGVVVRTEGGRAVELLADGAVVREGVAGPDGTARFSVRPVRDVALTARRRVQDCDVREGVAPVARVRVDPAVSLSAVRRGPRAYAFSGRVLPARDGEQVRLYRVDGPRQVLVATAAVRADGTWRVERRFLARARLVLQARAGAGASAPRPTAVF